ncbi:MAG TPA: hypothetical protein VEU08_11915 [Vicinamibacterales bacterium]|nr:hypothetical protein [Vicinamibacterales bacterium]
MCAAAAACNGTGATASNPASNPSAAATPTATSGTAAPVSREITLPAGTQLPIVLDTSIGSDSSQVEEPVQAHLAAAVQIDGAVALEPGSRVGGVVTDATRSGRVKGVAHVGVRFETLTPEGSDARYTIRTAAVGRTAQTTKKRDAEEIGGGAIGGAIIGALVGGKKGAAIGTAAGGGAGTAVVLSTRGKEVHLPKGARLTLRLSEPVTIRVRS